MTSTPCCLDVAGRRTSLPLLVGENFFDSSQRATEELQAISIPQGNLLEDVTITTAGVSIPHKLNDTFRGWFVTRITSAVVVVEQSSQSDVTKYVDLKIVDVGALGVSSITVDLWVF